MGHLRDLGLFAHLSDRKDSLSTYSMPSPVLGSSLRGRFSIRSSWGHLCPVLGSAPVLASSLPD